MTTVTDSSGRYTLDLTSVIGTGVPSGTITATAKNAAGPIVASGVSTFPIGPGRPNIDIALELTGAAHPGCVVCDYFPQTQYEVAFRDYFDRRGGVSTFGYPISRLFLFQGFPTQIFQRAVLQQWPDGSIHLLNLLDPGFMPFSSFNEAIIPPYDPDFVAHAPSPGSAGYAAQVIAFINANVLNDFAGQPADFRQTFFATVTAAAAFPLIPPPAYCQKHGLPPSSCKQPPGYGDLSLLPGFDLEIWGVPTSAAMVDPNNSQFVYQRFQRGVMHYQGSFGVTEGLLLGQYFKSILTGQYLPPDLAQEAANSRYLRQYCPTRPYWICRPDVLAPATTDMTGAFEPEAPSP